MSDNIKRAVDRYCHKQYRFKDNPLEQKYVEKWLELSTNHGVQKYPDNVLKHILSLDGREKMVSDTEVEIATIVIQWLGSPVGQSFIKEVQEGNA